MKYRKEIDGLRSLAVLPVILNHAKLPFFSGGFVGVDIFFVISGFLISKIIYTDIIQEKFSIISFYERRARRIVPALALIMVVSFLVAYVTMLPEDLDNFSQSVVATLLFSNNILLTITSGYWDLGSDFKPLLHTWSLGVEEQFYFIYPIILLVVLRFWPRRFPHMVMLGIILSLSASIILTPRFPNSSFYLIHTRAWELLAGALAAYYVDRLALSERSKNIFSLVGLFAICASVVCYSDALAYPSYYAVMPCMGAALILLFATPNTIAYRILSTSVLVGVGLISYSIYLWHQPLFAFARVMSVKPPSPMLMLALSVATLPLAYMTWRYVERPFRDRSVISRNGVFLFTVLSTLILGVAGLVTYRMAGVPERVPGIGLGHGKHIAYNERIFGYKKDAFQTAKPHLLVVGSSTARDLTNVMLESHKFDGYEIIYRDDVTVCDHDAFAQPHGDLLTSANAVVWAASYLPDDRCHFIDLNRYPLKGKPFVLTGPKHFGYNLNSYIFTPAADRPRVRAVLMPETYAANQVYRDLVPAEHYVDLLKALQARFGGVPVFDAQGRILSADRVHLTEAGAKFFAPFLFDDPAWRPILELDRRKGSAKP